MQAYATLLEALGLAQSRNRKLALLAEYFRATPDPDRGWALASLTDSVPVRAPLRRMLADLVTGFMDAELYRMSRDYVGDTAETVALLWPHAGQARAATAAAPLRLGDVVVAMSQGTVAERTQRLRHLLDACDATGRWALLKFIGGAPRVGVSARLARAGLAEAFGRDQADVEEIWHAVAPPYVELFAWFEGRGERPSVEGRAVFRPPMLAHPLEETDLAAFASEDFAAEWKWDGIRIQIAAASDELRIFSRQGDDISGTFPDLVQAWQGHRGVFDGELLVMTRDGDVAPFNDLQQRLNRKVVSRQVLAAHPAHVRLYDMLLEGGDDIRDLPFAERRRRLESWFERQRPARADLSRLVPFRTFAELRALWLGARDEGIEGLMLKRKASPYIAGRVKGEWWKWKRAPMTLDCVLMYAQRGSGKRSSFYSDYTFGVWRDEAARELVPVGKAYSGFTDDELRRLDRWIRANTVETFGPVRAVSAGLVLEVEFDAVQRSSRHKSGLAMRFPRIHRIRWDKPVAEADRLAAAEALIGRS